ncbi:hypothetical protein BDK51DRAFT_23651, partial [Blyttiomyces helicus]
DLYFKFISDYLDKFLTFSKTSKDHITHISEVLAPLGKHQFLQKLSKCEFEHLELLLLIWVPSANGLSSDPPVTEVIHTWLMFNMQQFIPISVYFE